MQHLDRETVRLLVGSQTISSAQAVVKELVENSLDAGATNIEVKLENFGLDMVEVCDNGSGIGRAEVLHVARPHYTSKITSFRDLCELQSYGFRGDALSSIASIAHLRVSTLCSDDEGAGRQYDFDSMGNSVSFKHVAMGQGTTVCVTGLFKSVPVRRQILKSAKRCREDLRRIEDTLLAFGIAHPKVRLVLKHNKCLLWQKIPSQDYDSNLSLVLGPSITQHLTPISFSSRDPFLNLRGYVPCPGDGALVSRSTPDRLFVFVNNRPVAIKQVTQILRQSFADAFPSQSGRSPVAVLHLDVPPSSLDINLDPGKTLVLLTDLVRLDLVCSTLTSLLSQLYSPPPEAAVENGSNDGSEVLQQLDKSPSHREQDQRKEADLSRAYPSNPKNTNLSSVSCPGSELPGPLMNRRETPASSQLVVSTSGSLEAGECYQAEESPPEAEKNNTGITLAPKEGVNGGPGKFTLLQWSRDKTLQDENDQPVQAKRKLTHTSPPTMLKRRNAEGTATKQPSLSFEPLPQTDAISFDLRSITHRITLKTKGECGGGSGGGKVVGYCSPPGVWLVVSGNSISCFLTARLLEVVKIPARSQVQTLLDHTLSTATDLTTHLYTIHEL